ncbi:MAG TPA: co-chaperone GroES [Candidatus Paceibacterota bacterium]|nr:co-chaperone GroES [Candidatus Paceibacterota bacterium]
MTPLGDRVLVKPQANETTTAFGIIIPDTAKEKPETGVVVAVGPGKKNESGNVVPVGVQVGDKVMFSKYGFDEVKVSGQEYYLISEANILAILNS